MELETFSALTFEKATRFDSC